MDTQYLILGAIVLSLVLGQLNQRYASPLVAIADRWLRWIVFAFGAAQLCRDFDLILVFHESANISFTALISRLEVSAYKNIAVVIGPEGGISESEIEIFESVGGKLVKLGAPVFRSAHAGVAALAAIQTAFKMW